MKKSLGMILVLCLVGLQLAAVGVVVFSSYLTSERALIEHARSLLSDVGTNTIEHSKGFLKPARGAAELATRLAENRVIARDNPELLERLLFQQLQITPQFAGVFYGDETGSFVYVMRSEGPGPFRSKIINREGDARNTTLVWRDNEFVPVGQAPDPADTYDPRSRPWYLGAEESAAPIWTDPYIFFSSQRPGITVASRVLASDGSLQGVIGVDIEINAISSFLSQLQIGENGTALILNQNGDVIAHPNQDLIKTKDADGSLRFVNIKELEDPIAQAAFGDILKNGVVSVDRELSSGFTYDNADYVSTIMPPISAELPWTIAVYAPEDDFTGVIKQNRTLNVWIASAIALATGIVGLLLANYIHKPVRAFAVRSALIDQGEISPSEPLPTTYKELEHANETLVQAIAARKKSEAEYGRTFDFNSRGMAQIDTETGKFMRVNAKLAEMLGYSIEELLGLRINDLNHPDDAALELFSTDVEDYDPEHLHERRYLKKDGTPVWVSVNPILIQDDTGHVLHGVVTVDDITDSKLSEQKIQRLSRDLSHSARVNMMGQMATTLAHEVNQPLTAISQNMDTALLLAAAQKDGNEELTQVLREADRQAHRAGEIIRALRGFVRKDKIEKEVFYFDELLRQTLHLIGPEARETRTTITVAQTGLLEVYGSRVQIAQVLVNLLRNAMEAMAQANSDPRRILIRATESVDAVTLAIADTGPGIAEGVELFGQFETNKRSGMGLGLSICKTIMEAHDGKLWHEPRPEGGVQFFFSLPRQTANSPDVETQHVPA